MLRYLVLLAGILFLNTLLDSRNFLFEKEITFEKLEDILKSDNFKIKTIIIDEYKNVVYLHPEGNITLDNPLYYIYTSMNNDFLEKLEKINTKNNFEVKYSPSYKTETTSSSLISYIKNFIMLIFIGSIILNFISSTFSFISDKGFTNGFINNDDFFSVDYKSNIFFKDVVGQEEAKRDLKHYINSIFLHPKEYLEAGYSIPKGLLFTGPPGTGKTLLAKAFA